ncbi:hypothetical protein IHE45_07G055800 [Dioscorea alata]|nr:hypothetical protein IHE45_07G055800 [Dioscorea alata]
MFKTQVSNELNNLKAKALKSSQVAKSFTSMKAEAYENSNQVPNQIKQNTNSKCPNSKFQANQQMSSTTSRLKC